jgi:hypothetical protein
MADPPGTGHGLRQTLDRRQGSQLAQLAQAGFRVPAGFVVTTSAYEHLIETRDLAGLILIELGRKPFASMRWEEVRDVALRIRTDKLWVRIGSLTVVAVIVVAEAQLQYFVHVLEQVQRLVDGLGAGGWELGMELVVQVGGAGMLVAGSQEAQQGDALRRQPVLLLPEPAYQLSWLLQMSAYSIWRRRAAGVQ